MENKSKSLSLKYNEIGESLVSCISSLNSFKTVYSVQKLLSGGMYYFEIKLLKGCNFKLGVCSVNYLTETAFCDYLDGFGYYSAGYLRNGSKTSGEKYGRPFRGNGYQDTIGVYVDLIKGVIFFSKKKMNNEFEIYPVAFDSPSLKLVDFYVACSCLTKEESF